MRAMIIATLIFLGIMAFSAAPAIDSIEESTSKRDQIMIELTKGGLR
jgi:hypothetical protein